MNFLEETQNEVASMSADDTPSIKWYVDAAFAVQKKFQKSHRSYIVTWKWNYLFYVYETESEH